MRVLIVESKKELGQLWKRHLERADCDVTLARDQETATEILMEQEFSVIILDLVLEGGSALALADHASFRQPDAQVVFVTNTSFFSDGTLFQHIPNLRAVVQRETCPSDLTEMVRFYAGAN
ncbi:response regulator [Halocynthiibacter sp.]|uniref:response regulator n=1 Tax=Halocynthiibacter sp. TaxID=1979210 RepID=UPI003C382598